MASIVKIGDILKDIKFGQQTDCVEKLSIRRKILQVLGLGNLENIE